jgi:hypothetical protein
MREWIARVVDWMRRARERWSIPALDQLLQDATYERDYPRIAEMGPTMFRITVTGDLATFETSGGRRIIFPPQAARRWSVWERRRAASCLFRGVSYWVELRKQR